tara:strand:+ start:385 stop:528 length:144 start_codon:yes stop_codon:yes gene_type:complete
MSECSLSKRKNDFVSRKNDRKQDKKNGSGFFPGFTTISTTRFSLATY